MNVRLISKTGQVVYGTASFSKGRGKRSISISFAATIGARPETKEFYLEDHGRAIMVWGQGMDGPDDSFSLHPNDARAIVEAGGG